MEKRYRIYSKKCKPRQAYTKGKDESYNGLHFYIDFNSLKIRIKYYHLINYIKLPYLKYRNGSLLIYNTYINLLSII